MHFSTFLFYASISIIVAFFSQLSSKRSRYKFIFQAIAILIPAIIAGIRVNIGTDYNFTYLPYFNHLKYGSRFWDITIEPGYQFLNWLFIVIGGNIQGVLFVMSFITMSCVLNTILKFKRGVNVGVAMFVFMMQYYFVSFNNVRQVCAAAICLCALIPMDQRNWRKTIVIIALAMLFHASAVLFAGFYVLIAIFEDRKRKILGSVIYVLAIVFLLSVDRVYGILDSLGIRYASYLVTKNIDSSIIGVVVRRGIVILLIVLQIKRVNKVPMISSLFHISCLGAILELLSYITVFPAERIALYFRFPICLVIGYLLKEKVHIKRKRFSLQAISNYALITFVIVEWYYEIFYMGYHETIPYQSIFGTLS